MTHDRPPMRGEWRTDLPARAVYSEGAGIARALPVAVAVPVDAEDVAALARWAHGRGAALVPRGSGSGMAGGAVGGDVLVDLSRLADLGPVDASRRRVRVGAGVIRDAVDAAARAAGLRFPVDPSSGAFCTVGGMAAANAAGARTLRFGAMRDWVTMVDCVLADGTRVELRRDAPTADGGLPGDLLAAVRAAVGDAPGAPRAHAGVRKDSSGYAIHAFAARDDPVDLVVGSEGSLALIVGLELALAPLPGATSSLLAEFATLEDAVAGAAQARAAGAAACELLDRTFLDVAAEGEGGAAGVSRDAEAVLLAEVEGDDAPRAASAARALEAAFRTAGARHVRVALDERTAHALWALRHAASPILAQLDPALKSMQFIEDGCVPPDRLADYVRGVRAALAARGIRGVIFGHAGDAHAHVNPLVDVRAPDWRARVESLLDEVVGLTSRLGGTLTGEHGDGRLRTPLLDRMWPADTLTRFGAVKRAFDPQGILNPGVKVPLAGQRALETIKYDPALPPLPTPARAALDRVERQRAYATPRLALL